MIVEAFRNSRQGRDIFRKTGTPISDARVEIVRADAFVQAHPLRHQLRVRADPLADHRDLVDERDPRREESIRRVLHHLRRVYVRRDQDRCFQRRIESGDLLRRLPIVASDHHAVRMHEVLDRRAFAQELGVGDNGRVMLGVSLLQHARNHVSGKRRHRGFVDHDERSVHGVRDRARRRLDVGEVRLAALAFRRADGDDRVLGARHCVEIRGRERQTSRSCVAFDQLVQAGLVEGDVVPLELRDLLLVDVDHRHLVAQIGQACCCRQPDVTCADDGDLAHGEVIISIRIRRPRSSPVPCCPS